MSVVGRRRFVFDDAQKQYLFGYAVRHKRVKKRVKSEVSRSIPSA